MKKTALIIMALGLFALATAGCEDAYKANPSNENNNTVVQETLCPDNASCQVMPDNSIITNYDEVIALSDVITTLPEGYGISRMTAVENEHSFTVAYPEPSLDINQIIMEYQEARDENLNELIGIQSDTLDRRSLEEAVDSEYIDSLQEGVDKLNEIKAINVTPSLKIKELLAKEI